LEAIPWTRFTVEAQAQLEKDGALRSRRLGALGSVDSVGVTDVETDDDEAAPEEAKAVKRKNNLLWHAKPSPSNARKRAKKASRLRATPPAATRSCSSKKLEVKKYNRRSKRHTLHKEIK